MLQATCTFTPWSWAKATAAGISSKRKFAAPGPHAEPVGRQIYRIGPELHGGPQLLHTARRRQKLHMNSFVHASILRDSRPLHPKSAAIRPEGPGSKGSRQ